MSSPFSAPDAIGAPRWTAITAPDGNFQPVTPFSGTTIIGGYGMGGYGEGGYGLGDTIVNTGQLFTTWTVYVTK